MSSVNDINPKLDASARVFNNFDRTTTTVDSNEYAVVNSYLKSITRSTFDADRLTAVFFEISRIFRKPVQEILDEIKGQNELQLTSTLAAYLNSVNSPSTLLGVYAPVVPNFYAARNVLP